MKTNQNESPHTPTGNAFNAAVAKILGQSDPGWNFTWTVPTDLGRLHIGITIDDGLGMTFLDAPAPEKLDEIGADRFTNRWNIAAESMPDPEMRLRELVKRLARVGWVPVVKAEPKGWTIKKSSTPADGEYDCAILAEVAGEQHVIAEVFGRVAADITQDAVSLARKMAAAPLMLEALQAITSNPCISLGDLVYNVREAEGQGWDGPAVKQWGEAVAKVQDAIKAATI